MAVAAAFLLAGHPGWIAGHLLVSWLGLLSWYHVKKWAVTMGNAWRAEELAPLMRAFHETILEDLSQ